MLMTTAAIHIWLNSSCSYSLFRWMV